MRGPEEAGSVIDGIMRKQQAASTESTKSQRLGNGVTMSLANYRQS